MSRIIVMGASSGMGYEAARRYILEGNVVGIAARRTGPLKELQAIAPERVFFSQIDITTAQAPAQLMDLIGRMGGLDLYFHASGIGKQNKTLEPGMELKTVETNCFGMTNMVDAVFHYFEGHGGGQIAVITSIAGTKGLGPAPSYSASKAYECTYIQAMEQLANARKLNIRFTDLRPGFVRTPFLSGSSYPMLMETEPAVKEMLRAVKKGRHVWVTDWRYRIFTGLWQLIPRFIWRRLNLVYGHK